MAPPNPANVNDFFAPRLALIYAAFFLAAGWYLPLFPVWLAARGLDPAAIGVVLATAQVVRVVGTPAGTRLADRFGMPHRAILTAALVTAAVGAALGNVAGFAAILAVMVVYALVSGPIMPLIDAYALRGLSLRGRAYGPVRLWGSIAFIAANLSGGVLLDILAPGNLIWLICAGQCSIVLAALMLAPLPPDEPVAPSAAVATHSHLRQPRFLAIAAAGSLIQASHAVYYGFSTLDWSRHGFDGKTIGILWALGVVAEIVLFASAARLPPSIGPTTLILIGATGAVVRWIATAFDPPFALLAPLQLLHALSFGATHLGTMQFLSSAAPPGGRATAQGDVATANNIMMACASALSGVLYGMGGSLAYAAMALFAAAGVCACRAKTIKLAIKIEACWREQMFKLMIRLALIAMTVPLVASGAYAQSKFPERTIRLVVPFAAGGGVDTFARLIAQRLQDKLGGAVIVENRAGANSTLGGNYVMQAAPDGYTLLFSASTHISARLVMAKAPYDPIADFTPVARVGIAPMLVVMAPNKPQKTLSEVVESAKKHPPDWSAATPALGSPGHLATIAFANLAGFTPQIIPYRGTAPALNDVAGGHVQLYIDAMIALLPMAQAGSVKPLAITGKARSKLAPEIPTAAEGGMPGLDIHSWYAVWGPKGMPDDLVKRLNGTINDVTADLAKDGKLDALGIDVVAETPDEFAKFETDEVARNAALLKSVNFQPE